MRIVEEVEKSFNKKIPCMMTDAEGNNWSIHGMVLSAYHLGHREGQDEVAVHLDTMLKNYQHGSKKVVVLVD